MRISPTEPFAGSSIVSETLVWFSKSDGQRIVLSGHPQMASAIQTANLFLGDNYTTEMATTNRELHRLAAASPDVEFVVVDVRTASPPVAEFVQAMRQHPRTAEIPIAILSDNERDLSPTFQHRRTMTRFDRRHPDNPFRHSLSLTYPRPSCGETARWIREDLFAKTGSPHPNPLPEGEGTSESPLLGERARVRGEMAKQALRWLREIKLAELETGTKIYHFPDFDAVVLDAMRSEVRFREGLALAAVVRSPMLQQAIYDMAANAVFPMWLRELAGDAFEEHVERFGVLLRGNQVQQMYDRFNASEFEPVESQELLGRLIDVVEESARNR